MEGALRFRGRYDYFVLWRSRLYQWKNRPQKQKRDFSSAESYYVLSELQNLETDPSQRHVLILKFPRDSIELAATNPGSYQAWLSCFAVFHVRCSVRKSLDRKAPYLVSSTYMKAIWVVLDDIHWRGCQTEHIFLSEANELNVDVLRRELLTKGPGTVDPNDYSETTVATVAKVLLDSLPESLWTEQALSEFGNDIDVDLLRQVIVSLPEQNCELLKKLFITLSSVASNVAKSKMSEEDLAKVIAPVLDSRENPVGSKLRKITKLCISEYQHLFIGAPHLIVVVPKIEDILTYKRMDFSNKKRKKKHQPHGCYRNERMPRHADAISERKQSSGSSTGQNLALSSDDDSSDSHSRSHRQLNFLRPQFTSEYSPRFSSAKPETGRAKSMILTGLPELGPVKNITSKLSSNLTLALAQDQYLDEKTQDNDDSFDIFQNSSHLIVPGNDKLKFDRGRSKSVVLNNAMTEESSNFQYNSRNIRNVVGKRRSVNTRLVKSLVTDSFFVYAYLSDDERSLSLDGLFPAKPKRHSTRHRIQLPIAEDEECEEYQKDLIEQNKKTEFFEVFGPSQSRAMTPSSLRKKL